MYHIRHRYDVAFAIPQLEGEYASHITIDGEEVHGSPFAVMMSTAGVPAHEGDMSRAIQQLGFISPQDSIGRYIAELPVERPDGPPELVRQTSAEGIGFYYM